MAVDRPTFDDNWHRVSELRPRLRSVVQVHRQPLRGVVWHVYRDPGNNRYFRAPPALYHFIALLDGERTVGDAWKATCERFGDEAPTQGETTQALGMLYTSNLLRGELPPDVSSIMERRRKRQQREAKGYLTNLLFAKIPLADPDAWLTWLVSLTGWLFGWFGALLWLSVIFAGLWAVSGRIGELTDAGSGVLSPDNLIFLTVAFVVLKLIHELGHGLACKAMAKRERGGGEVRQVGVMMMAFMPLPYVDATSSWSFRSKWRRIVVAAAGMYVEIFIAALAAMLWSRTPEGTLAHQLSYNVMFVASVTTLLFNANPLIRFDGYYILSDIANLPNLYQRSQNYLKYLVKRYAYGVRRPMNPAHNLRERIWFVIYGIAAFFYKIFLFASIILFVADQLFFIGALFAIWALVAYTVVPLGKLAHYLASHGELVRCRVRSVTTTLGFTALLFGFLGLIPWADHGRATGVVEPRHYESMALDEPGFVLEVAEPNSLVPAGAAPLVVAEHRDLMAERAEAEALLERLRIERRRAMNDDPAQAQAIAAEIRGHEGRLSRIDARIAGLSVVSDIEGVWLVRDGDRLPGSWQDRGMSLGAVVSLDDLIVRLVADQYLGPRLRSGVQTGDIVEVRVRQRPNLTFIGRVEYVLPAGREELPSDALGYQAGGPIAMEESQDPQQGPRPTESLFEVRLAIDADQHDGLRLLPGQVVEARFDLGDRPLLSQGYLALRQLLQRRFQI